MIILRSYYEKKIYERILRSYFDYGDLTMSFWI